MAENFNLIFGSQAPTTASWSDADYQTGWNVVGSTPPTAEQFDALQNRSDKKAQELNNRMLPLEQKAEEQGRQAGTAYTVGAAVTVDGLPADWLLVCTTAGTSGTVAITLPDPLLDGATINDGTITWTLRKIATNGSLGYRQPSTAYTAGQIAYHSALPAGYYLECTTAGTTGSGDITPSSTIGGTVSDGTVTWKVNIITNSFPNYVPRPADLNDLWGNGITDYGDTTPNRPYGVASDGMIISYNKGNDFSAQIAFPLVYNSSSKVMAQFRSGSKRTNYWSNWLDIEAIVAKSLGTNGYIKYASGLILQWGTYTPTSTGTVTINTPISYDTYLSSIAMYGSPEKVTNDITFVTQTTSTITFIIGTVTAIRWFLLCKG